MMWWLLVELAVVVVAQSCGYCVVGKVLGGVGLGHMEPVMVVVFGVCEELWFFSWSCSCWAGVVILSGGVVGVTLYYCRFSNFNLFITWYYKFAVAVGDFLLFLFLVFIKLCSITFSTASRRIFSIKSNFSSSTFNGTGVSYFKIQGFKSHFSFRVWISPVHSANALLKFLTLLLCSSTF